MNISDKTLAVARRSPRSIILVRVYFLLVILAAICFCVKSRSMSKMGMLIFGGSMVATTIAMIASFMQHRACLVCVIVVMIAIPAALMLAMDLFILNGQWWEWVIMVPVQLTLPFAWGVFLWRSDRVTSYYT